jgi:hypothetical protein
MNPQLIQIMRAALEEVMAKIPADDHAGQNLLL